MLLAWLVELFVNRINETEYQMKDIRDEDLRIA